MRIWIPILLAVLITGVPRNLPAQDERPTPNFLAHFELIDPEADANTAAAELIERIEEAGGYAHVESVDENRVEILGFLPGDDLDESLQQTASPPSLFVVLVDDERASQIVNELRADPGTTPAEILLIAGSIPTIAADDPAALRAFVSEHNPPGQTWGIWSLGTAEEPDYEAVLLTDRAEVLEIASVELEQDATDNTSFVSIVLTSQGREMFGDFTRDNVGHRVALVVEDEVLTAPFLTEWISGGWIRLTLGAGSNLDEVTELRDRILSVARGPALRLYSYSTP